MSRNKMTLVSSLATLLALPIIVLSVTFWATTTAFTFHPRSNTCIGKRNSAANNGMLDGIICGGRISTSITRGNKFTSPLLLSSSRNNDNNGNDDIDNTTNNNTNNEKHAKHHANDEQSWHTATVAGASVSPRGFLVLLKTSSFTNNNDDEEASIEIAFPIQLTSSSSSTSSPTLVSDGAYSLDISANANTNRNNTKNKNTANDNSNDSNIDKENKNSNENTAKLSLPSLFQENIDQTSVTTPEALTFLQLVNGVDMATPIFPPDSLSLIVVLYSFLLLDLELEEEGEVEKKKGNNVDIVGGGEEEEGEILQVEDELGLSTSSSNNDADNANANADADDATSTSSSSSKQDNTKQFTPALEYIRAMVQTTLLTQGINYLEASSWQRAKVQLPHVWLHGVRLQELSSEDDDALVSSSSIATLPIQYILECSVDDGSKRLDIPLFAIPSNSHQSHKMKQLQQPLEVSKALLQEISHSYNSEASASFISLALFHRYYKSSSSGGGSGDNGTKGGSPSLTVSKGLLNQMMELQKKQDVDKAKEEEETRYCWTALTNPNMKDSGDVSTDKEDNSVSGIDALIQSTNLPMYRPLQQLQEEDQRVLQFLKKQNFGKGPSGNASNKGADTTVNQENNGSNSSSSSSKPVQKKKVLTLEQQAKQQQLKAAWKIAMQRGDEGALEKIQKAMQDMENELAKNESIDNAMTAEEEEGESSLQKIQRAMKDTNNQGGGVIKGNKEFRDEDIKDVVGLIADLEEAASARYEDDDTDE